MRIYTHYKTTEDPWGGINSFNRAFKNYIIENRKDIKIIEDFYAKYDIIFLSAASSGKGKETDIEEIKKRITKKWFHKFINKKIPKIILRLDGLRAFYSDSFLPNDQKQIDLADLADYIIFQSNYSLNNFKHFGYNKNNYSIINNGVDQNIFNLKDKVFYNNDRKLKILSVSWSNNLNKGFQTISDFSENNDIEVYFVGNWNTSVKPKSVNIISPLKSTELAKMYKQCDVFLHSAKNDPCPNVVLEALSCGLPVIHTNSGGTPEIAEGFGIKLPDLINQNEIAKITNEIKENYNYWVNNIKKEHYKFSMQNTGNQYLSIFENILKKGFFL